MSREEDEEPRISLPTLSPEDLEELLKRSLQVAQRLLDSRKKKDKMLAEYNLGQAAGIIKTLNALGHEDWAERVLDEMQEEEDEAWSKTEGGKAWNAGEEWMGRKVYRAAIMGRPPYPGAG